MARKLIFGIFISAFAIFAMSHNVSAITPVIDLNNYDQYRYLIYPVNDCTFTGGGNYFTGQDSFCRVTINSYTTINSIKTHDTYSVKKGDIVNFYFFVYSTSDNITVFPKLENISNNVLGWDLLSINQIMDDDMTMESTISGNLNQQGVNYDVFYDEYRFYSVYRVYELTMRANKDGDLYVGLNTGGGIFSINADNLGAQLVFSIKFIKWFRYSESKENKEVEEKTQSAVDDSAQSGESSQGSVEGSTQNLMSAGASIISALSNAPATDCNINMSTSGSSSAFTGAIGSVNLCSGVPSGVLTMVQGIVALVFTPIVLYYTYSIITTIYKQFREYNS